MPARPTAKSTAQNLWAIRWVKAVAFYFWLKKASKAELVKARQTRVKERMTNTPEQKLIVGEMILRVDQGQ